jgi:hypothetical protein
MFVDLAGCVGVKIAFELANELGLRHLSHLVGALDASVEENRNAIWISGEALNSLQRLQAFCDLLAVLWGHSIQRFGQLEGVADAGRSNIKIRTTSEETSNASLDLGRPIYLFKRQ